MVDNTREHAAQGLLVHVIFPLLGDWVEGIVAVGVTKEHRQGSLRESVAVVKAIEEPPESRVVVG
jgi:hypothetical protein